MIKNIFPETLSKLRHKHNAVALAEKAGLHRHTLSKFIDEDVFNDNSRVSFGTINKLCQAFDIQVSDILVYVPDSDEKK